MAGLGTGDHLSFGENIAYGLPSIRPTSAGRPSAGCARALLDLGLVVWIGGRSRRTVAVAEDSGAVANLWQASPSAAGRPGGPFGGQLGRHGEAGPGRRSLDAAGLLEVAAPLAQAGASWLVFGWPVGLQPLAEVGATLAAG